VLRGRPSWRECLALVDAVVNASAPCQVSASRPACRLGSAQPEHQGSFLALTGAVVLHVGVVLSSQQMHTYVAAVGVGRVLV
jgi:hypothetical protein